MYLVIGSDSTIWKVVCSLLGTITKSIAVRGRDKEKNGIRRNLWQVMLPSKDVFGLGNGGILQHF